tara:strand:- start:646 stop:1227 length:582 start_codon:yes stop_codon:yes gene_type:complete
MQSVYNYVVEPLGGRYNNTRKVGDKELILNTEVYNHQHVNREAKVLSTPRISGSDIQPGDIVTLHHNVFRRWHDVKGRERNSSAFLEEGKYLVALDQIYLYKKDSDWICPKGYCFVQPIKDNSQLSVDTEKPLVGIVKYSDGSVNIGELVGFRPRVDCESVVDGNRLYKIPSQFITIKYEYQGDEEEYNPSWA